MEYIYNLPNIIFISVTCGLILHYLLSFRLKSKVLYGVMLSIAEAGLVLLCFFIKSELAISAYIMICSVIINVFAFELDGRKNIILPILSVLLFESIGNIIFGSIKIFYNLLSIPYSNMAGNLVTHIFCLLYWIALLYFILKKFSDSTFKKSTSFFVFITVVAFFNTLLNTAFTACIFSSSFIKLLNMHTVQICIIIFSIALIAELSYIIYIYYEKTHYSIVTDFTKEYLEIEKKHFEELREKEDATRRFRHDINAHLSTINAYINSENYDTLRDYMNSVNKEFATIKPIYQTGNATIDSVLNSKANIMKENNIHLNIDGNPALLNVFNDFDVCTIFSNAISNAIEANNLIEDMSNRWINIKIRSTQDLIAFEVSNPLMKNINIKKNRIKTTKEDKKNHGYGLIQIAQVIENLKGYMKIECENKIFHLKIQINYQ